MIIVEKNTYPPVLKSMGRSAANKEFVKHGLIKEYFSLSLDPKLRQEVVDAATAAKPSYSSSENLDTSEAATSFSTELSKEEELLPEQVNKIHIDYWCEFNMKFKP